MPLFPAASVPPDCTVTTASDGADAADARAASHREPRHCSWNHYQHRAII